MGVFEMTDLLCVPLQATNIKTGLRYCLYRIHGYRLNNVKVTQLVDMWKKLQHSSVTQLREVFTTKAFGDNCKSSSFVTVTMFTITVKSTEVRP